MRKKLDELQQKAIAEEEKRAQELACAEQERLKEEQGGRPFQQEEGAAMEVARKTVQEWQQKAVEEKRTQELARHAPEEQGQKEETARVVAQKKVAEWRQNAASEQVGQKPAELASEEAEENKKGHADADAEPEWRQEEQEKLRQQEEGTAKKVAQKKVQEWQQRALETQSRADAADCQLAEKKEEAARLQKEEVARDLTDIYIYTYS